MFTLSIAVTSIGLFPEQRDVGVHRAAAARAKRLQRRRAGHHRLSLAGADLSLDDVTHDDVTAEVAAAERFDSLAAAATASEQPDRGQNERTSFRKREQDQQRG